VFSAILMLGFSDTARAQTVTLSGTGITNNTLNLSVQQGGVSPVQAVQVTTSADPSTVNVQVSASSPWIQVQEAPGGTNNINTPVTLHVKVVATALTQGTQSSGTITVSFLSNPSVKQVLTVNVTVNGSSLLSATPASLSFTAPVGAAESSIPTQSTTIASASGTLNYTVSSTTQNGQPWLVTFNSTGMTGTSTADSIVVGVNPGNLPAGVYQGSITVQSTSSADAVVINVTMTLTANTTISVTPSTLQPFLYQIGTTAQPGQLTQTLQVSSSNSSVPFQVTMNPQVPWLVIQPTNGATGNSGQAVPVTLNVNTQGLGAAVYTTNITVGIVGGATLAPIPVQLVVSTNPLLNLSTTSLNFNTSFNATSAPPSQAVQVSTVGNSNNPVSFTVANDSPSWLNWSAPTLSTPGTITVYVNPASLAVGPYTGHLTVRPNNSDMNLYSLVITVTLNVGNAAQVTAGPPLLLFSWQTTQPGSGPTPQVFQLQTTGTPVSFALTTSTATAANCPQGWLSATSTATTTQNATVTVSANITGVTPGVCSGTVTVSYPANSLAPQTLAVPVTLDVSNSPLLNISMPLGFGTVSAPQGSNQITQTITLTSTDPSMQITDVAASPSSNGPQTWLYVGQNGNSTPQSLQVIVAPGSLPPNTYGGSISISSSKLPSSPVTIPFSLTVTSNVTVMASPLTLTFNQASGGPLPASQNVTLTSSGTGATFQTSIPSNQVCSWLQVTPTSGPASGPVAFSVQANSLPQNSYTCPVTFSFLNSATQPITVNATLVVGASQTLTVSPPSSMTFTYQLMGSAPASQPLTLTSTGGSVAFTAAATSTGGWLGIDSTGGATGSSGSKVINVSVDPTKIPSGTAAGSSLMGQITINAPGVLANPVVVTVTLNVVAAPAPSPVTITNSSQPSTGFGAIAPGEIITIKGTNLTTQTCAAPAICISGGFSFSVNSNGTVPSTLGGVQVLFDSIPGTPIYVSATQINVIVPWEIAGRTSTNMIVANGSVQSAAFPLQVAAVAPGIYTQDATGSGQAAVLNLSSAAASPYNGPAGGVYFGTTIKTAPAPAGSAVVFYLTGGGLTSPVLNDGTITPSNQLYPLRNWTAGSSVVTATVGGQPATVLFAGAAPTLINAAVQINLQLPAGVTGPAVPVVITIDGVQTQSVNIAIQ
jgi:uncharacterized protein (TIGR03437 family)